jgi:hypothetical protein
VALVSPSPVCCAPLVFKSSIYCTKSFPFFLYMKKIQDNCQLMLGVFCEMEVVFTYRFGTLMFLFPLCTLSFLFRSFSPVLWDIGTARCRPILLCVARRCRTTTSLKYFIINKLLFTRRDLKLSINLRIYIFCKQF